MGLLKILTFIFFVVIASSITREIGSMYITPITIYVPYEEEKGPVPAGLDLALGEQFPLNTEARIRSWLSLEIMKHIDSKKTQIESEFAGSKLQMKVFKTAGHLYQGSLSNGKKGLLYSDAIISVTIAKGKLRKTTDYSVKAEIMPVQKEGYQSWAFVSLDLNKSR